MVAAVCLTVVVQARIALVDPPYRKPQAGGIHPFVERGIGDPRGAGAVVTVSENYLFTDGERLRSAIGDVLDPVPGPAHAKESDARFDARAGCLGRLGRIVITRT